MTLRYADTSAIVRAYLPDEDDHAQLRALLLEGSDPVVTSELTRLEIASAVLAAERAQRIPQAAALLATIDQDCGDDGPLALLRLRPDVVMDSAHHLIHAYPLRTLDAIHVAIALQDAVSLDADGDVVFVTRDKEQAAAATAEGLRVA